jgi:hypothetical protein
VVQGDAFVEQSSSNDVTSRKVYDPALKRARWVIASHTGSEVVKGRLATDPTTASEFVRALVAVTKDDPEYVLRQLSDSTGNAVSAVREIASAAVPDGLQGSSITQVYTYVC